MENSNEKKSRVIHCPEGMVDTKRAAVVTGYTVLALQQLCQAGQIPHSVRGSRYFFSEDDLKKILKHVEPKPLPTAEQLEAEAHHEDCGDK